MHLLHSIFRNLRLFIKKHKYRKFFENHEASEGKISFRDEMFEGNLDHYLSVGKSAMIIIEDTLRIAEKRFENLNAVLDIPCGHGRVMRHMVKKVDGRRITGCDLDFEAVEFCVKEFGCKPLFSNVVFENIEFEEKFDLIWVGSLFTHLDESSFERLLKVLISNLNDDGILVFSAHGTYSLEIIDKYNGIVADGKVFIRDQLNKKGFYFTPYENLENYGISISLKSFVEDRINKVAADKMALLKFTARGWDNHHDVYSYIKRS